MTGSAHLEGIVVAPRESCQVAFERILGGLEWLMRGWRPARIKLPRPKAATLGSSDGVRPPAHGRRAPGVGPPSVDASDTRRRMRAESGTVIGAASSGS